MSDTTTSMLNRNYRHKGEHPPAVAGAVSKRCPACNGSRLYGTLCRHSLPVRDCPSDARPHWHTWCLACNTRSIQPYN